MISFISKHTLENIKYKFLILYILNVTDMLFTIFLLSTGLFIEINYLMAKALQSLPSSFMLKIILPAALLLCLYIRMKKADETQLKQSNIIINVVITAYLIINFWHLVCVFLLCISLLS